MKRRLYYIAVTGLFGSAFAMLYACGGSGGSGGGGGGSTLGVYSGKTTAATIDATSVKETLAGMSDILPSCTTTGTAKALTATQMTLAKTVKLLLPPTTTKRAGKTAALLPTTAPSTQTGDCGGTLSYPTYSHSSGTTTVSIKWDNYCTIDSDTGNKTTMNGTLSAVDAGTPTASGPVTNNLTASIPSLTVVEKTAAGATVSSTTIALSNFKYVPATGATADITNIPGTMTLQSVEIKAIEGAKTTELKIDNLNVTTTKEGTDSKVALSGTICRGTSGCSTVKTDTPLLIDTNQNLKSGAITFTGANNSNATLTSTGSTGQKFNVSVNGTTLTGTQLTCDGL